MKAFLRNQEDNKDLIQIRFDKKELKQLHWEDEHEFRYQGEMYDVIEMKFQRQTVLIRCIADEKETALLNEYQKNNKRNGTGSFIFQLITAPYLLPNGYLLQPPQKIIKSAFADVSSSLQNPVSAVTQPPPNVC